MSGALDAELGPEAVELIAEYGTTVTLNRATVASYNVTTGKSSKSFGSNESLFAIVEDETGNVTMPDGSTIKGDKKLTIAALGLTKPEIDDKITVQGIAYRIGQIKTIMSGELACLYIVWAWVK